MRNYQQPIKIIDAVTGTTTTKPLLVQDYRHIIVMIATASNAQATIQGKGTILEDKPDFDAAASVSNPWDFVQMKDLEDASSVDGDTGVVYSGTDAVRIFEVNVNALSWFTLDVTAYTVGSITAWVMPVNDNHE